MQRIRALGRRAGGAINPATRSTVLDEIGHDVDLVLTVDPGFGHQQFIRTTVSKIERLPGHETPGETAEMLGTRLPRADEMDAYGRVLADAMQGDATLFAREDCAEEAWRIVDPVVRNGMPVYEYEPGTWEPREVDVRLSPPGGWHNPTRRVS